MRIVENKIMQPLRDHCQTGNATATANYKTLFTSLASGIAEWAAAEQSEAAPQEAADNVP